MGRRLTSGSAGAGGLGTISVIANTIATTQTDQDLVLDPNGTGVVTTADPLRITNTTGSSSTSTGALTVTGGLGIGENLFIGGTINVGGGGLNNITIGAVTPAEASFTDVTATGLSTFAEITEVIGTKTGATGVVVHDYTEANTWYHSSMSANFTMNLTNVPTTNNRTIVVNLILIQGGTARYANAFQIDGAAQTIRWANYAAPTPQASRFEIQTFTLNRVSSTWQVYGSLASYG